MHDLLHRVFPGILQVMISNGMVHFSLSLYGDGMHRLYVSLRFNVSFWVAAIDG